MQNRYEVPCQVVLTSLVGMMTAGVAGSERAFMAILDMKKLDFKALESANHGDPEHSAPEA